MSSHFCILVPFLLANAVLAQRALLDRLPATAEAYRDDAAFGPELQPVALPGDGTPQGLARIGAMLWIARGGKLHGMRWPEGNVLAQVEAPKGTRALAADERFVYALTGSEVVVLDPLAGRAMRTVALATDEQPLGLACHQGRLYLLGRQHLFGIDLRTGAAEPLGSHGNAHALWLLHDGSGLLVGSGRGVFRLQLQGEATAPSPAWQGMGWPRVMERSAATWIDGKLLLLGELRGAAGPLVVSGLLTPQPFRELLSVKIFCQRPGSYWWQVGPERLNSAAELDRWLASFLANRATWIAVAGGEQKPMPIAIEPYRGVPVAEVARTWDAVAAAGFAEISSPALEAFAQRQPVQAK